jgi:hypothetical protein
LDQPRPVEPAPSYGKELIGQRGHRNRIEIALVGKAGFDNETLVIRLFRTFDRFQKLQIPGAPQRGNVGIEENRVGLR